MCGIMGYVGEKNAVDKIITGLEVLEYRGYDSAGLSLINFNQFNTVKTVGSPSLLWDKANNLSSTIAIGHTRWATHGAATLTNAHPHTSMNGIFTVVHNGIIENYKELKQDLSEKGYNFVSETDTEVIAHLLELSYNGDLKGTVSTVISQLKGSFALGILCIDYPDTLICAKKSSPLFAGTSVDGTYLASDISALVNDCERIYKLNDLEIGFLRKDGIKVYDTDGCRIRKNEVKIKSSYKANDKNGYKHYMLKEIYEQPTAVRQTLSQIISGKKIQFKSLKLKPSDIKEINSVKFIACGSAYHAGMVGAYLCEEIYKRPSQAEVASEFRYKKPHIDKNTLVIIISQSGETADTLAALRIAKDKNAKIISIVNVENSTIAMESDCVILTQAGPEIAVATTKAYSAQLAVIYSLVIYLATVSGELDKKTAGNYIDDLKTIPEKMEQILTKTNQIKALSEAALNAKYVCFIGRCYNYCTAMEASLKLKEISYIPCEAYPAGELKHGTISLIDDKSLVIAISTTDDLSEKIASNVNEVIARGANVISLRKNDHNGEIEVPHTTDFLQPMLDVIPLQLFAYFTAEQKGCEIDKPRNLAKSVTVE